jgi:hypothetical protein
MLLLVSLMSFIIVSVFIVVARSCDALIARLSLYASAPSHLLRGTIAADAGGEGGGGGGAAPPPPAPRPQPPVAVKERGRKEGKGESLKRSLLIYASLTLPLLLLLAVLPPESSLPLQETPSRGSFWLA